MDKITYGNTFEHNVKFSQNEVNEFAKVTGDNNPIHVNEEYASATTFGRPIVHGFFAASVFSKVFGTLWPGEGTIYLYQDLFFLAPVYVETEYIAKFEVVEVNTEKHSAVISCILSNDTGAEVIKGKAKIKHTLKV